MPLYDYGCKSCEATIERRQGYYEPPLTECPECGGELKRLLQPIGIIFKGNGWYCTDNRPKSAESGGEAKPKAEATAAAK